MTDTWATDRTYTILGSTFRLLSSSAQLGDLLDRIFHSFLSNESESEPAATLRATGRADHPGYFDLSCELGEGDPEVLVEDNHFDRVAMKVIVRFNSLALHLAKMHTVHAGVVALNGRAIAFPASSGHGKSTLVAACAQHGFDYVSDEALCLDWETGLVIPYAKPLWLSRWSRDAVGLNDESATFLTPRYSEAVFRAEDLGWGVPAAPLHLETVVSISAGGDELLLSDASGSQSADLLVRHAFSRREGERIFRLVGTRARAAQSWDLTFDNPNEAAKLLASQMEPAAG